MSYSGLFTLFKTIRLIVGAIFGKSGAGRRGERTIRRQLWWLPDDRYAVINDLLFTNYKGNTTQIDHVVVSQYGIFVIETKNISGKIYGSDNAEKWCSYWRYRDLEFGNPVLQNKAHINALAKLLKNYPGIRFVSIIAFTTNADLRVQVSDANVMYSSQVRRFIKRQRESVMSYETARGIYNYLQTINIKDSKIRRSHAERAQQNRANFERKSAEAIKNGLCPKCGNKLVLRQGKYGSFYGCSNYPNCKYTLQS